MGSVLRIGNAQAFWGDSPSAPQRLVQQQPDLDYLTLDYLSELSLSILAVQREKDRSSGYARDFIDVIKSLLPFWRRGSRVKVISNAGGLDPRACAMTCYLLLKEAHLPALKIGIVLGDDVLPQLRMNPHEPTFSNLETGESLKKITPTLATANAYLGAHGIAEALRAGADIVITGRVADPSLTVGPCLAHFGWAETDYDRIAAATIAGHLIECGTQVTGGISTKWMELDDPVSIGFPVVEMSSDGSFVVTKPPGTGGAVTIETVKEQLLYEIGDPDAYLSPDATVSFLGLHVEEEGKDRVRITGAKGKEPPSTYKVSACYRSGYKADGVLLIYGHNAPMKAKKCGEVLLERLRKNGHRIERSLIECLGTGDGVPGVMGTSQPLMECVLRISVADSRKDAIEAFSKELASLVTSGPQGVTGYSSGRPSVRPVFGYWPCLIPREKVKAEMEVA